MLIQLSTIIANYRKYGLNITGILHVGAHLCEEMVAYKEANISNIHWVEGNPDLAAYIKNCNVPNVYQELIGEFDGQEVDFIITNDKQASSILELHEVKTEHPTIHEEKRIKGVTKTLKTLLSQNNSTNTVSSSLSRTNFINLDIQGAELMALKGLGNKITQFDLIYTEINVSQLYKGCGLLEEMDLFLVDYLRVDTVMTPYGWGDAVYIKKSLVKSNQNNNTIISLPTSVTLPSVSVIIRPTNQIIEAVQSVYNQTYIGKVEIIISTNTFNTTEIEKRFPHSITRQIKFIPLDSHNISWDEELSIVTGDYIAFLEKDDTFLPTKLTDQITAMLECGAEASCTDCVINGISYFNQFNKSFLTDNGYSDPPRNITLKLLQKYNWIITSTMVIKKSLVNEVGKFNNQYQINLYWDYWRRVAITCEKKGLCILFVNQTLTNFIDRNNT